MSESWKDEGGCNEEMVKGMVISGNQAFLACWLQVNIGYFSFLYWQSGHNFVLAFTDKFVTFVILTLAHGSLFDGGDLIVILRVEVEDMFEFDKRVNISCHNEVILRKFCSQFFKRFLQLNYLAFIFLFLRTKMNVNQDELITDKNRRRFFGPIKTIDLSFTEYFFCIFFCLEDSFSSQNQFILPFIIPNMILISSFHFFHKIPRKLLQKPNICLYFVKIANKLIHLLFLTQKRQVIKRAVYVQVEVRRVFYQFSKVVFFESKGQESVKHHQIVKTGSKSLLFSKIQFFCLCQLFKMLIPFSFKLFPIQKAIIFDAYEQCKARTVPSSSDFLIDLSHIPFELSLIKFRNVLGKDPLEGSTDFYELLGEVVAIELKWIVHDVTIVESSYLDGFVFLHSINKANTNLKLFLVNEVRKISKTLIVRE